MVLPVVAGVAGVDGSAESLAAAEQAAREAVRRAQPLHLPHVWNWHPRQQEGEIANAAHRHLARRSLRQAKERVRAAYPDIRHHDLRHHRGRREGRRPGPQDPHHARRDRPRHR